MQQLNHIDSIYCGTAVWDILNKYLKARDYASVFVLTDSNTAIYCLPAFMEYIDPDYTPQVLEMPAGEAHKSIDTCMNLWNQLSERMADRNSLLINLGGGVVTDLGGFVASTFKRGIDFINIPTSLLAMVDASVGGKNGVDLGSLKNQIGVLRIPELVLLDEQFLKTLPKAHLISGMAEMLKHGLITSEAYFDQVLALNTDRAVDAGLIWESVLIKSRIVSEDPSEKGLRKTLNYGHTLGHAIESYCLKQPSIKTLLHGEAIAIGMILATYISSELLTFPKVSLQKVTTGIRKIFELSTFTETDIKAIIDLLIYDKKNRGGKIYFVLLNDFGQAVIDCEVPNSLIISAFDYYKNF
jgi:3-dehydroquinate synthase